MVQSAVNEQCSLVDFYTVTQVTRARSIVCLDVPIGSGDDLTTMHFIVNYDGTIADISTFY